MPSIFDDIHASEQAAQPARLNNNSAPVGGPGGITPPPPAPVQPSGGSVFDDIHASAQRAGAASDFFAAAPRSVGLPDTAAGWKEPPKNDIQEIWDAAKEGRVGHAAAALGHMLLGNTPGGAQVSQAADHLPKAYEAFKSHVDNLSSGNFTEAAKAYGEGMAHIAGALIPGIGDYSNAADKIGKGDVAGGAGDITFDTIRNLLGLKFSGAVDEPIAEMAGASKGRKVSSAWTKQQKKLGPDWPDPVSQGLTAGFGASEPQFPASAAKALPMLRAILPQSEPLDFAHLPEAIRLAEEDNKGQAARFEAQALSNKEKFDLSPIAAAKRAAIPAHLEDLDPTTYKVLMDDANSYDGKSLPLDKLKSLRATNNAILDNHYGKTDFGQYNDIMTHARQGSLRAETEAARDIIAKGIDPEHGGGVYKELNQRLKAILDLKEAHANLYRQLQATSPMAKPGVSLSPFDLLSGGKSAALKTAGKFAMSKFKDAGSPYKSVDLINKALKTYENYSDASAQQYGLPRKSIDRLPEPGLRMTGGVGPAPVQQTNPFVPRTNPFGEEEATVNRTRLMFPPQDAKEIPIQQLLFPPEPREAPVFPNTPIRRRGE